MKLQGILVLFIIVGMNAFAAPKGEQNIELFPNPVTEGNLNVEGTSEIKKIEILSIVGEVLHVKEQIAAQTSEINIDLHPGLYLLGVHFTNSSKDIKRFWVN